MKNPLPHLELGPDHHADINSLLTVLESIIRQQNEAAGSFYTDTSKTNNAVILSLGSVNLQGTSVFSPKHCFICFPFLRKVCSLLHEQKTLCGAAM